MTDDISRNTLLGQMVKNIAFCGLNKVSLGRISLQDSNLTIQESQLLLTHIAVARETSL